MPLHFTPQPPQLLSLVLLLTSQPSVAEPLQSRKPALHAKPHTLAEQIGVALARAGHGMPQPLQLRGSLLMSTQAVPHGVVPPEHTRPHTPLTQLWPAAHAVQLAPQNIGLLVVSTHDVPHLVVPIGHTSVHTPVTQF